MTNLQANQCDGCNRALPIRNGLHYNVGSGLPYMACTRESYEKPSSAVERAARALGALGGAARVKAQTARQRSAIAALGSLGWECANCGHKRHMHTAPSAGNCREIMPDGRPCGRADDDDGECRNALVSHEFRGALLACSLCPCAQFRRKIKGAEAPKEKK